MYQSFEDNIRENIYRLYHAGYNLAEIGFGFCNMLNNMYMHKVKEHQKNSDYIMLKRTHPCIIARRGHFWNHLRELVCQIYIEEV